MVINSSKQGQPRKGWPGYTETARLIILDLGLPDRDGQEVIRELRGWTSLPILILSARGQESDKVKALDAEPMIT